MTKTETVKNTAAYGASASEFTAQVELALSKSRQTQRPFFVVLLQIENLGTFQRRRSNGEAHRLLREIHSGVRRAVHASQHVGIVRDGLGIVFDAAEPGQVDLITRRLIALVQGIIRAGGYNDLTAKWTDVLFQFLIPGGGGVLKATAGWAIYPRDGETSGEIVRRSWAHLQQEQTK